jgi:hypothetical protein
MATAVCSPLAQYLPETYHVVRLARGSGGRLAPRTLTGRFAQADVRENNRHRLTLPGVPSETA